MKVLLARKDVTLSSAQSVGLEPTSRINDHGLAVRSNNHYGNSANVLYLRPHTNQAKYVYNFHETKTDNRWLVFLAFCKPEYNQHHKCD